VARFWRVDALRRGAPPGTVHRVGHDDLLALPQAHAGAHHLSLPESLRWIAVAHPEMSPVRYTLWGVEPAVVEPREGLSEPVAAAVPAAVEAIVRFLHRS
jgi:hydrogenase maturation protease